MRRGLHGLAAAVAIGVAVAGTSLQGQSALRYRFTFPEPQHHWMAVEATLTDLPSTPLELRMSRSSPGRYSLHNFAKNVYDVEVSGPDGRRLAIARSDPHGWTVPEHGPAVTVRYKVFGDRVDGTYLAVDPTHAHMNMPASLMWARGLDDRTVHLTFVPPDGVRWTVATQLYPTATPNEFTAPNLQYLMDSPAEFGPVSMRQFTLDGRTIRLAVHHDGTDADLDRFVTEVQKIVAAEREVFGEFPTYEPGSYTFLADYLPWAGGDGMEHRNSTVVTSPSAIRSNRAGLLGTIAHEFFHGWNVERIRPRTLEPFDFERANLSGELWLGEGFTQYYGPLSMSRAAIVGLRDTLDDFNGLVRPVLLAPGRHFRSAEEMSHMAAFADGGRTVDRTNWSDSYISYYPFGGAIALALDLTLRERSDGRVTLDDFMRALWRSHGKPPAPRPGYVASPYTMADAERRLAEVSGDAAFAREFFGRYIRGRAAPDFAALLAPAGFILQKQNAGRAWWGNLQLQMRRGPVLADAPRANTPAYKAGLDSGDELRSVDGARVTSSDDVDAVIRRHKPGDVVVVDYVDRSGTTKTTRVTLVEDPDVSIVPVESTGLALTQAQAAFRAAWLGRKG